MDEQGDYCDSEEVQRTGEIGDLIELKSIGNCETTSLYTEGDQKGNDQKVAVDSDWNAHDALQYKIVNRYYISIFMNADQNKRGVRDVEKS